MLAMLPRLGVPHWCSLDNAVCGAPFCLQEMLYTLYVPSDEETPASLVEDDGAKERQGLLAADGSLAAPYVSHTSAR